MTITLPAHLEELKFLVGFEFPQADEDALRRCAGAWRAAAGELRMVQAGAEPGGAAVHAALDSEVGPAFDHAWQQVARPGTGLVDQLASACQQVAAACEHASTEVEYAKLEFIGALAMLAYTIGLLLELAFAFLVSAAAIPAAVAAAQLTIRGIVARLLAAVGIGELGTAGLDAAFQGYQLAVGHRDHWDGARLARDAEDGAIFGLAGAATFGLAGRAAPALLDNAAGRAGLATTAGLLGSAAAALVHGELPTGAQFLHALPASLVFGLPAAGHGSDGGGYARDASAQTTLAGLRLSTVDGPAAGSGWGTADQVATGSRDGSGRDANAMHVLDLGSADLRSGLDPIGGTSGVELTRAETTGIGPSGLASRAAGSQTVEPGVATPGVEPHGVAARDAEPHGVAARDAEPHGVAARDAPRKLRCTVLRCTVSSRAGSRRRPGSR